MKETINTLKYTGVLSFALLCLFFIITFAVTDVSNASSSDMTELAKTDADAILVSEKMKDVEHFRDATISTDTVTNLEYLQFIFDNLNKKDYKIKKYEPTKIICEVNSSISFVSGKSCKILSIKNKKINEYKNILFKWDKEIEFVDFEYKGYECKNDGKSYYCLVKKYSEKEEYKGYSLVDKIYKKDNRIIVYEYYLSYKDNYDTCVKYYNESYCVDDYKGELPAISEDNIKKYGTYFRHEFIKEEDNVYLDKSFIVNE